MGAFLFWIEMHPSFLVSQKPGFSKKPGFLADRPQKLQTNKAPIIQLLTLKKIADFAINVNTLQKKILFKHK